jgi:hypothetical protein
MNKNRKQGRHSDLSTVLKRWKGWGLMVTSVVKGGTWKLPKKINTEESGLCHPLLDLNRHDASFTATRPNHKPMLKTCNFSATKTPPFWRLVNGPWTNFESRHRRMHSPQVNWMLHCELSRLNASLIEYRIIGVTSVNSWWIMIWL